MSLSRASTSRWRADCGTGRYSSLDTIWVGTGEGKVDDLRRQQRAQLLVTQEFHHDLPQDAPPANQISAAPRQSLLKLWAAVARIEASPDAPVDSSNFIYGR